MFRFSPRVQIHDKPIRAQINRELEVIVRDLSTTGAYLITDKPWPNHDKNFLELIYQQKITFTVEIMLTRQKTDGWGVQFNNPSFDTTEQIRAFLHELLSHGAALDDKRSAPRMSLLEPVTLEYGQSQIDCSICELSLTGCEIIYSEELSNDTTFSIFFGTSAGQVEGLPALTSCEAQVVRKTARGYGLRFKNPSMDVKGAISVIRKKHRQRNSGSEQN